MNLTPDTQSVLRRKLIGGAIAGSAAGMLRHHMEAAETPQIRLGRTVRVGLIGFEGHTGEITGPLAQLPEVEVVALASAEKGVMEKAANRNKRLASAAQYTDYRELLAREKLDVAAVCNNNGERAEVVLACARRKLNFIAEKPLALRRADLQAIRETVEANRISAGMLLPMRSEPPYQALKQLVDSGAAGEIAQIDAQKSYQAGRRDAWYLKRKTYGGTIAWIGIHMIDLMRWTSGREFTETFGFQGHVAFPDMGEMENVTTSVFRLDNGGTATLRMDYLRPEAAGSHGDDRLRLAGTKGVIEYMAATGVTVMKAGEAQRKLDTLPTKTSIFVDYLRSTYLGAPPSLTVPDIWRVNEITIGAQEAADQKKLVRLS